jgi:serine/threonine protein kinase
MSPTPINDTERYRRLRDLVDRAAERPAAEWAAFLERECPADPTLRAEALHLLGNAPRASKDGFLDHYPTTMAPSSMAVGIQGRNLGLGEPSKLGKYEIVERFSEKSGQAAAYKALDPDLRRHVVLKRYHAGPHGGEDEKEEGRALARVKSPYVAGCHGIERIGGEAFLIVEFIPGRNLAQVHRDEHLPIEEIVRILALLAEGVSAVHARGLIHRDIKPANVILHDDGNPRLVDFGLATHLGSNRLRGISGTPQYMAPEQARGEWDRIDQRADIFGLGALLYTLLTDHAPHEGATVAEVLDRAKKGEVTSPRQLDPAIPASIEAVCMKALAAAPENRYTTALEFAAALRQAIKPPPPPPRVRWHLPAAVIACGVLALAVWFWPRDSKPPSGVASPIAAESVVGPIQAEISVKHFKELGDGKRVQPIGMISEKSLDRDPPQLKDLVRVHVTLSRPAYSYLIALNPDGKDQLCTPAGAIAGGSPRRELDFPEDPANYFGLTDGVGLQAFVAVVSDRPLPAYDSWKTTIPGGLAWSPVDREGLWTYDSAEPSEANRLRGRLRGEILRREAAPEGLNNLCDRLRRSPGVSLVHALAFPVKPDVEIIK